MAACGRNAFVRTQVEMSYNRISKSSTDSNFVVQLLFSVHVFLASFESDCICFVVLILHAVAGYRPRLNLAKDDGITYSLILS